MTQKPLYQSFRASFDKDIYLPVCGIVAAPTVVWEILAADDLAALRCDTPPQNVILHVAPDLTVTGQPRPSARLPHSASATTSPTPFSARPMPTALCWPRPTKKCLFCAVCSIVAA